MSASPHPRLLSDIDLAQLRADLENTPAAMARYILRTADYGRTDRLWPAHFLVFITNPLNVAYGACGTALFLHDLLGDVPAEVIRWMLAQPLSVESYPPGLYFGLAGIAYTFQKIGLEEEAEAVMTMMGQSPLLYQESNMLLGAAGWGLASLHFFVQTREQLYLDQAVQAGEYLLQSAQHEGETCYWRCNQDGMVHYGFGYGASGIALFLMYLHLLTGRADFYSYAIQGLEFDLANRVESKVGWQWKRFQEDTLLYPYWIHGSAGIGSTLIRFSHLLGIARYETLARQIAEDTFIKYAFIPSLFEGLAGIGEFMLDMFYLTRDETYRDRAFDIADTVLWFRIDRPEGVAYPGRWLTRISNDYATGAAGIGLFFTRLLRPHGRLFVDLDLDAVVGKSPPWAKATGLRSDAP
ncbi:MAG: lanthionine synthetase C family protein [Caldilineaceae bacterium]|nr:lanthionine synthetase C family protein [Caldilineaceae bacterium]